MGHFSQLVATEAKVPVVTPRTAGSPATVTNPSAGTVARELLQLAVHFHFLPLVGRGAELLF